MILTADELKEKLQNNEISIGAAMDVAHLSPSEQKEVLQKDNVTSTTVKNHTEKKKRKRLKEKIIQYLNIIKKSFCKNQIHL